MSKTTYIVVPGVGHLVPLGKGAMLTPRDGIPPSRAAGCLPEDARQANIDAVKAGVGDDVHFCDKTGLAYFTTWAGRDRALRAMGVFDKDGMKSPQHARSDLGRRFRR